LCRGEKYVSKGLGLASGEGIHGEVMRNLPSQRRKKVIKGHPKRKEEFSSVK